MLTPPTRIPLRARDGSVRAWATIDAEDYQDLAQFSWHLNSGPNSYAVRNWKVAGRIEREYMHRRILGLTSDDARQGDHLDRDKLNNRRSNLRIIPNGAANGQNLEPVARSSKYRGVWYCQRTGRWGASVRLNYRLYWLGRHDTEIEAAQAASEWRRQNMPYSIEAEAI